jgi:hypothetical protein
MFITNNYSIREVLAFPFLREDKSAPKEKFAAEVVDVQPLPEEGIRKSKSQDAPQLLTMSYSPQVDRG